MESNPMNSTTPPDPGQPTADGKRDYLPAERQDIILNILTHRNVVTVAELANTLGTTEITVRRDLAVLSSAGLLKRVRGGAMSISGATEHAASASLIPTLINAAAHTPATAGGASAKRDDATDGDHSHANGNPDSNTPTIGIMMPAPSFFWPVVIHHMNDIAQRHGLRIITRNTTYEPDVHEDELLDELAEDPNLCGLIVTPSDHAESGRRTWDWIERHTEIPVVAVERDLPSFTTRYIDSVLTNHIYGVRKAAAHFLRHGHTCIGAAFTPTPTSGVIEEGWRRIVEASAGGAAGAAHRIDCPFIIDGVQPYDSKGVNRIADAAVASGVTALLVHSDYLAIALAQALERRGRRVPDDVSLISVDGFVTPNMRPLTVIHSSEQDLAAAAVSAVINRIQHPDAATRHIYVDPALIDRGSVVDVPANEAE